MSEQDYQLEQEIADKAINYWQEELRRVQGLRLGREQLASLGGQHLKDFQRAVQAERIIERRLGECLDYKHELEYEWARLQEQREAE